MGEAEQAGGLARSVEWRDGRIAVIDQTLLPERLEIRELTDVDDVVDAIGRLVVRGAPAIGVCGAYGLVIGLRESVDADDATISGLAATISAARPTAVNLSWAVERVSRAARTGTTGEDRRARALAEAQRIEAENLESCRRIGEHGRTELGEKRRILTHCNTGRLATAGIGTALGVVYTMARSGSPVEVYATETRPLLQGARLTAWELHDAGIPVTLLPDSAAAGAMSRGLIEVAIVGCDRVARNGDTANKVGTYSHAVAAARHGIPFYVAGPMSSFDPDVASGEEIEIEQRDPDEVRRAGTTVIAPDVAVMNPAFDITPAELITAFITDVGVLRPPFEESIADALERAESEGLR
jgi:methylthioribose-1-phosphate isomerase